MGNKFAKKSAKKSGPEDHGNESSNDPQTPPAFPPPHNNPVRPPFQNRNPVPASKKNLEKNSPAPKPEGPNLEEDKSIVNPPDGLKNQKHLEEIKCISEDVSGMPDCAEKTTLILLTNFLQSTVNGVVNLPSEEAIENTYENLGNQLKNQELYSQSVSQTLSQIKSKTSISDLTTCLRKLLKEIRPLNIREIVRLVTKAAEGNSLISGQDIVLFIGETGTGKSTTIQFLAGCKMGEKRVEIAKGVFIDHHIEAVSFPDDNPTLKEVKSSCLNQSETRYIKPVKIDLRKLLGVTAKGFMNLCDAPGSGDTAGAEIDIANGVGIINAIKQCTSVKVVALISSRSGNRGEGIRKLARLLVNLIKDIEDRLDSILYLFTKYPRDYNSHGDLISLKESLETTDPEIEKDSGFMMVINDMIEKTENETLIVDPIEGDPKKILKTLIKMKEIKNPDESFQYALTQDSNNTIRSQIYKDLASIACGLKNKNSELALFYLNNIKTLNDLIEKDFLKEAYTDAINLISETLQNCVKETKAKFNKALHSQDGLQQEDIQEYNNAIDYIKSSQIFIDHLDVQLFSPNLFLQNISIELEKIKTSLNQSSSQEYLFNSLSGVYLDNILVISPFLPEFQILYKSECKEIADRVELLFQEIQESINKYALIEFSEKVLVLFVSINVFKKHSFSEKIKQSYIASFEALLRNLSEFSNSPIFSNQKITAKEIPKLEDYLNKLKAAKESPVLQDRIATYTQFIKNDKPESFDKVFNLNSLFTEFFDKIRQYSNNIFIKIQSLLQGKGAAGLTEIQTLIVDLDIIREIPDISFITAKDYYQTVDTIRGHAQDLQQSAERLLDEFDPKSENIKWGEVIRSLSNLQKNVE